MRVEAEDWPLVFLECLGKAKVAELGAGRVNSERREVFVRAIFIFCRSACRTQGGWS